MDLLITTILMVILLGLGTAKLVGEDIKAMDYIFAIFMLCIAGALMDKVIHGHMDTVVKSVKEPTRKVIQSSYNHQHKPKLIR